MLTPEQLLERRKGIGASDGLKIVKGEWHELWLDKTGRKEPEAILSEWDERVRHAMEPLVMDQYERDTGNPVEDRGASVLWKEWPVMRCTLDGYDPVLRKPVDAKALNIWTPDPIQWCVDHYHVQMQQQMLVTNSQIGSLYVSLGMKKPVEIPFERDDFFLNDYLGQCHEFWGFVERDEEPTLGRAASFEPVVPPEKMRKVDMKDSNFFASAAADWLKNKEGADAFAKATKDIKALMEPDMAEAFGHGIRVVRDKRGVTIKEKKT